MTVKEITEALRVLEGRSSGDVRELARLTRELAEKTDQLEIMVRLAGQKNEGAEKPRSEVGRLIDAAAKGARESVTPKPNPNQFDQTPR